MSASEFNFGDQSVATAYDTILVPILFDPWAFHLVEDFKPWGEPVVLDLAAGTGIVTQHLARQIGSQGTIIAADINSEMLRLAGQRCASVRPAVEFIESPAHPLELPDESVDCVVCQQGFQFFPDKPAAAAEIRRVLRGRGKAIITTWKPVTECEFFGCICTALEAIGEDELSRAMRLPFDHMPAVELRDCFQETGFEDVHVRQRQHPLTINDGPAEVIQAAYATPIGPGLRGLAETQQARFQEELSRLAEELRTDDGDMGRMVANELTAVKPE